jgi:hypothetical protein
VPAEELDEFNRHVDPLGPVGYVAIVDADRGRTVGSWGYGPFDDDTAMDFVDSLVNGQAAHVMPALLDRFDRLASSSGTKDYNLSVEGLAATALVAGFAPYPADERRSEWVAATIPPLSPEVAMLACQAINAAYGDDAILTEFAVEAGNLSEHLAAIEPVRQRLQAAVLLPQVEILF